MGVRSLHRPIRFSLLLSALVHLLLLLVWIVLADKQAVKSPEKKVTWIEVDPVPKVKDNSKALRQRVVQTERGEKVDKAKPDSFLGWQNQTVDRETVSKNRTTVIGSAKTPSKHLNSNRARPLSNLGIPMIPLGQDPAKDEPEWATPGARPEDFIPGMKESDRTALNSREYVYYGYYQRIRERLDRAWIPILRTRLLKYAKSGRQLASNMDHVTKVLVFLNQKGEIVRVQIVGESGISDLDDAAIGAFNRAGPFPNPPKNMFNNGREIKIPWDFILKT